MLSLSPIKLMAIVTVVMVLLGPDKLPEVARRMGTAWRSFKKFQDTVETEVRSVLPDLPSTADVTRLVRSPVQLLNHLADHSGTHVSTSEIEGGTIVSEKIADPITPTFIERAPMSGGGEMRLRDPSLN